LNSSRSGSTSFMFMRSGRPPTLWWLLIVTEGPPVNDAFDHVRVERALRQEIGAAHLARFGLEHVDEGLADELALGLGSVTPSRPFRNSVDTSTWTSGM
jgi:hypothetical protein